MINRYVILSVYFLQNLFHFLRSYMAGCFPLKNNARLKTVHENGPKAFLVNSVHYQWPLISMSFA